MLRNVLLKTLRDVRRSFAWWSLGLVGMVALMVAVYPSVRANPELNRFVKEYPEALKGFISFGGGELDYTSPAGYLGTELFSFMIPLLLLVAAIGAGARAVAGEEETGTLELLLAAPVSRRRLALEKLGALLVELLGLALVLWVSLWVGARAAGMDVSAAHLGTATASAFLLALLYGSLALLVGAATGRRAVALGVTAAAAVAAYLLNSLATIVTALGSVQKASPYYHYAAGDPLRNGLTPSHVAILLALTLVAAVLAPLALERRDVAVA